MCFRPSELAGSLNCPKCGKRINAVNDVYPAKCPFCQEPTADAVAALTNPGAAPAPGAPAAPAAPAPAAPKPPQAQ